MDKLYWGAVVIFAIGWYIEQRMYVDGYTRRKRDPYKPIDYLGMFSIGEFVGYLIRCLIAPAFVWRKYCKSTTPANKVAICHAQSDPPFRRHLPVRIRT